MENQGQRPIPLQQINFDCLSGLNRVHHANCDYGKHCRQAGEKGQYSLGPGATKPGDENLQRGAQQK
jgi:hypothetical protein